MADINWRDTYGWAAAAFNAEMNLMEEELGKIENLKGKKYNEIQTLFNSKYGEGNFEKYLGLRGSFVNVSTSMLAGGLKEDVVTQLSQGKLWPIVTDADAAAYSEYFRIVKRIDQSYGALWKSKNDAFQVVLYGDVNMMLQWWATSFFDVKSDYYKASTKLSFQLSGTKKNIGFEFQTIIAELAGGKAFLMDAKNPGKVIKDWGSPAAWEENIKEWEKQGKKVTVRGLNLGVLSEAFIVSPIFAKQVGSKLLNGADLFIDASFGGEMYGIPYNRNVDLKGAVGSPAGVDFTKLIDQNAVVVVQTNEGVVMQPPIKTDGELGVVVSVDKGSDGKQFRLSGKQNRKLIKPKNVRHIDNAKTGVEDADISVKPGTLKTRSWRRRSNKAWVIKGPNGWYQAQDNAPVSENEIYLFEENCIYGALYKLEHAFGAGKVTLTKQDAEQSKRAKKTGDYEYMRSMTTSFSEDSSIMSMLNPVEIGPYKRYADLLQTIQSKL